jgi:hypothetical protein
MARAFTALLDGFVLQRVEEGEAYRRADMERRMVAFADLVAPRRPGDGRGQQRASRGSEGRRTSRTRPALRDARRPQPDPNAERDVAEDHDPIRRCPRTWWEMSIGPEPR